MSVFHQRRSKAGTLVTTCLVSNYFRYSPKPDATATHHTLTYVIIQLQEDDRIFLIPSHSLLFPFSHPWRQISHPCKQFDEVRARKCGARKLTNKVIQGHSGGIIHTFKNGRIIYQSHYHACSGPSKAVDYLSFGLTMATYLRRWLDS